LQHFLLAPAQRHMLSMVYREPLTGRTSQLIFSAGCAHAPANLLMLQGALAHRQAEMLQGLSELEAQERKVLAATSALHQVIQHQPWKDRSLAADLHPTPRKAAEAGVVLGATRNDVVLLPAAGKGGRPGVCAAAGSAWCSAACHAAGSQVCWYEITTISTAAEVLKNDESAPRHFLRWQLTVGHQSYIACDML
jgi:hypothetical protein